MSMGVFGVWYQKWNGMNEENFVNCVSYYYYTNIRKATTRRWDKRKGGLVIYELAEIFYHETKYVHEKSING